MFVMKSNLKCILSFSVSQVIETSQSSSFPAKKPVKIVRSSKVRYIEGKLLHNSMFIQKLPKLSNSIPGESNGFSVSLLLYIITYMYLFKL